MGRARGLRSRPVSGHAGRRSGGSPAHHTVAPARSGPGRTIAAGARSV